MIFAESVRKDRPQFALHAAVGRMAVKWFSLSLFATALIILPPRTASALEFVCSVVDSRTQAPLPVRVYLRSKATNEWLFVESTAAEGSALPYREQWVPMAQSVERHTTVSAHPFRAILPPGRYQLAIVRGKEYFPYEGEFTLSDADLRLDVALRRWVNMAEQDWYSGETHVHRRSGELANVQLAEDLNVAFPVTFWTVNAYEPPNLAPSPLRRQGPSPFGPRIDQGTELIQIDDRHVYFPRNTEYEIFNIDGRRHTLGALFILNHRSRFTQGMPPVAEIAEQAHREGALLDLDKHSWPWAMMLIPVAKVDLYELSNNSVWRTNFGFRNTAVPPADYMQVERDGRGLTELGWLQFGFENYYALLNCGFRLAPTAGTASGVHPVPLGFSRVYVHTPGGFDAQQWLAGLKAGRSFVTTGPMLRAQVKGQDAGAEFQLPPRGVTHFPVHVKSDSMTRVDRIEVIVNGRIVRIIEPPEAARSTDREPIQAQHFSTTFSVGIEQSGWLCLRSFSTQPDGRQRFAHTAPWYFQRRGQRVLPRVEQAQYLVDRVQAELQRSADVLPENALAEFRQALDVYRELRDAAREREAN